jgi:allantoate deiminase
VSVNLLEEKGREELGLAAQRILDRCEILSEFTETPGSITRTFLSAPMKAAQACIRDWMHASGFACVSIDNMGNLRGVYQAQTAGARRLLIGSHIDTVPFAGRYDGVLGVVLALEMIEALEGRRLPFEIEVVAFSEEEGVRFGSPFLGSKALVGRVTEELLKRTDSSGKTLRQTLSDYGLDPERLDEARIGENALAYLEFHIEQGPVLDHLGHQIAIVDTIAGQSRLEMIFQGHANHAGTTPMRLRNDALAAAAELTLAVESEANAVDGLVATVGRMEVSPGAANVIPGKVHMTVDIRHGLNQSRTIAVERILEQAQSIARRRGIDVESSLAADQPSVVMNPTLRNSLEKAASLAGLRTLEMVSGAGHDAMIIAQQLPVAMVFLRSPKGISHHPEETVLKDDVIAALETGLYFLNELGESWSTISEELSH